MSHIMHFHHAWLLKITLSPKLSLQAKEHHTNSTGFVVSLPYLTTEKKERAE